MGIIKPLQSIGNSKGVIIDQALLKMLDLDQPNAAVEIQLTEHGLLLKPSRIEKAYKKLSKKHRKSLDKLGE